MHEYSAKVEGTCTSHKLMSQIEAIYIIVRSQVQDLRDLETRGQLLWRTSVVRMLFQQCEDF